MTVYNIDDEFVVASSIEKAIALYCEERDCPSSEIDKIDAIGEVLVVELGLTKTPD